MNQYLDKEGRKAGKADRAVLRSPFSVKCPERSISLLVILCAFALIFGACDTGTGSDETSSGSTGGTTSRTVEGVVLDIHSKILIVEDGPFVIKADLNPPNASNKKITWTTSDPLLASVEGTSTEVTVTPLKSGTVTITATTADGSKTDACVVDIKTGVRSFAVTGSYQYYYDPNEPLNLDEATLDVVYADGSAPSTAVPVTMAMVSPLPFNWNVLTTPTGVTAGSETRLIPVRYGGATGHLEVTIRAPRYATIIGTPARAVYGIGAPLNEIDLSGLEVVVFYETGESRKIPATSPEIVNTAGAAWSGTPGATSGTIGPLSYKGVVTTTTAAINMTTLNGFANIAVAISPIVIKMDGMYSTVGTPAVGAPLLQAVIPTIPAGKTAEITLYNDTVGELSTAGTTLALNPNTNITLLTNKGLRKIISAAAGTPTVPIFTVSNGATLTLGDNILVTSSATPAASSVVVSGAGSKFTMKEGSTITQVPGSTVGTGFLNVRNGAEAVIEKGATVNIPTGAITAVNTANTARGILVETGGTLTLSGNVKLAGAAGTGGVGDVVIDDGTLVLDGTADVGTLALVTSGPFANPVTVNTNWNSLLGFTLNLVGKGPVNQFPANTTAHTIITAAVNDWYDNKTIFKGQGTDGTVTNDQMGKVSLGNFYYNGITLNVSIFGLTAAGGLGTGAALVPSSGSTPIAGVLHQ